MDTTDTTEANATITDRVKALRDSIVDQIDGATDSGKAMIASRRDGRRRDELLHELGEAHLAGTVGEADQSTIDRIVAEINVLDAHDEAEEAEDDVR